MACAFPPLYALLQCKTALRIQPKAQGGKQLLQAVGGAGGAAGGGPQCRDQEGSLPGLAPSVHTHGRTHLAHSYCTGQPP